MRLSYVAQHHFTHLGDYLGSTPLHYMQLRFRNGWDAEVQKRLTMPQSPEEEEFRKEMAIKHGKRGKEVDTLLSRQKKGKKVFYEVKWKGLDDAKQNTYENLQKLRLLGVEKMAAALDDRLACAETQLRPLTTREIVKHLEPFGITEDMTTHRMIGSFSAGQKSKLMIGAAMWTKPHAIAFDEPTNYLDFQTVRALGRAINLFRGGTMVVSHHAQFVKDTCEEIWVVEEGRVQVQGKDGAFKGLGAKNEKARLEKEKSKLDAKAQREEKESSGPSEQEKALKIHLQARQKMGATQCDIKLMGVDLRSPDGTELLLDTEFTLVKGRRYGLVGRNGTGKSTLLREVAYYRLDKFPKNLKVLLVEQEVTGDARLPVQWVLDSDVELRMLRDEQKELQAEESSGSGGDRLKIVADRLQEIGADQAESRAIKILKGLQFTDELLDTPTSSLSGGWRMRVSLASALFAQPELLLLDEPTNHLDFPAVMYLEEYLASFKNTCIIVSHDRGFLNNVVTDIVWLNGKKLSYQRGDYEQFRSTMAETRLAQQRAYDTQQKEIAHIMEFINKIDNRPKIVAQKESKKKVIDKMEKIEDPSITFSDSSSLSIQFPVPGQLPKSELIQTDSISFAYPDRKPLFENATIGVDVKSRIGILGANGAGKSTLLKVMQGKLVPQKGTTTVNKNMRTGTFAQHHVEALDLQSNCVDCVQSAYPGMSDQEARNILGRFGIGGDMALRKIVTLSGGQKSRVALAIITYSQPHLIFLDEPTNHLDMETIEALVDAVKAFKGAMVMVSHDQFFLSQVATEFWSVANGKVKVFRDLSEAKAASYKDP
jgi:ATPase subunit of ABC transporter with duplicated ATPase domains